MTWDFVYYALLDSLDKWRNNLDTPKFNLIFDFLDELAYSIGVSENDTPDSIIDNIVVNWDYAYEWEERYNELLESWDYLFKSWDYFEEWTWIILVC